MKIALLSGAYKNAGDFLIVKRSKELIQHVYPECIITEYKRRYDLTPVLDDINEHDVLVLAGGPGYTANLYPNVIPFVKNLADIKPKIFSLGMGWWAPTISNVNMYNYKFTEQTKQLFTRIEADGSPLGCREWEAMQVLKNNGFTKTIMTGCPAWYNLHYINQTEINLNGKSPFDKICISDPGQVENYLLVLQLVDYLKENYSTSQINFVFHRGIEVDEYTSADKAQKLKQLKNTLEGKGVKSINIAYGTEGFSIYDTCTMHIGFRVHAHIYNLSRRNASILIEEDSRGEGLNGALGLQSISCNEQKMNFKNKYIRKVGSKFKNKNEYLIKNIDDYIHQLNRNGFSQIRNAFFIMERFYATMIKHIKTM